MADRDLALVLGQQQVGPLLRRVLGFDLVGVVHDEIAAGVGDVPPARIGQGLEGGDQAFGRGGGVAQQFVAFPQRRHVGDVGGAEHVALRRLVLDLQQEPLIGDLAGGADDGDPDARIARGEGLAELLGFFGVDLAGVPGDRAFLGGGRLQRLEVGPRVTRAGYDKAGGAEADHGLPTRQGFGHGCVLPQLRLPTRYPVLRQTQIRPGRGTVSVCGGATEQGQPGPVPAAAPSSARGSRSGQRHPARPCCRRTAWR